MGVHWDTEAQRTESHLVEGQRVAQVFAYLLLLLLTTLLQLTTAYYCLYYYFTSYHVLRAGLHLGGAVRLRA